LCVEEVAAFFASKYNGGMEKSFLLRGQSTAESDEIKTAELDSGPGKEFIWKKIRQQGQCKKPCFKYCCGRIDSQIS
jgi:hypothetical protein